MQEQYEAPELTFIGRADEAILGSPGGSTDGFTGIISSDFEFEQD